MDTLSAEWQEKMAGYVLGDLTDDECTAFELWLQAHPEAQMELARLQETASLLPYGLDGQEKPSAGLRGRILQETGSPRLAVLPRRNWPGWVAAVAAVAVAVLGLDGLRLRSDLAQAQQEIDRYRDVVAMLRESNTRLVSLKGMDDGAAASGSIVVTPGTPEVVVTLRNLPMLPEGQIYRLWAVVDGRKVVVGQFKPAEGGSVFVKLPLSNSLVFAPLVVTREPATATTASGPMVMTSQI